MIKLPLVLAAVIAAGPCNAQEVRVFNGDQQHVYGPGGQILDTPELRAKNERARQMRNEQGLWVALPEEVDRWWRKRSQMKIVGDEGTWEIEGAGRERARLAFAILVDGELKFSIEGPTVRVKTEALNRPGFPRGSNP